MPPTPAVEPAGLAPIGFRVLRYTATTELIDVGVPLKRVQEWMGHHDPTFTMRVYAKGAPGTGLRGALLIPRSKVRVLHGPLGTAQRSGF